MTLYRFVDSDSEAIARGLFPSGMVPVEPDDVDTILRYCLPLITERQVRAVVTLLGVGGETP